MKIGLKNIPRLRGLSSMNINQIRSMENKKADEVSPSRPTLSNISRLSWEL